MREGKTRLSGGRPPVSAIRNSAHDTARAAGALSGPFLQRVRLLKGVLFRGELPCTSAMYFFTASRRTLARVRIDLHGLGVNRLKRPPCRARAPARSGRRRCTADVFSATILRAGANGLQQMANSGQAASASSTHLLRRIIDSPATSCRSCGVSPMCPNTGIPPSRWQRPRGPGRPPASRHRGVWCGWPRRGRCCTT